MALVDVDVVFVDLMKTLMFGGDRLEDWPADIAPVMAALIERMAHRYDDPASWADFPTLAEALDGLAPPDQQAALVDAFAAREVGTVPPEHARAVRTLAAHRPVVLVSNIWAPPQRFEQALADAGLSGVFTATVWSGAPVRQAVSPAASGRPGGGRCAPGAGADDRG